MKKSLQIILTIVVIVCQTANAQVASNPPYTLEKTVIASGGQHSTGGQFSLEGTIGQPIAGNVISGGQFAVTSGFWSFSATPPVPVGIEADVASRPNGGGTVNSGDVTQVQRFAVGLDKPFQSNEFQRADSAPRMAQDGVTPQLGNGSINSGDITQAQRYAVGLDKINGAIPAAGGPAIQGDTNSAASYEAEKEADDSVFSSDSAEAVQATYEVRAVRESLSSTTLTVAVRLDTAAGATQAASVGGTLLFDPAKLSAPGNIRLAGGAPAGTSFFANTTDAASGKIGFTINAPVNQTFAGGQQKLLLIDFTVIGTGSTQLRFDNSQAQKFVGDTQGNELPNAEFPPTEIALSPTSALVTVSGKVVLAADAFSPQNRMAAQARVWFTDNQGRMRSVQTNRQGYFRFEGVEAGYTYIFEAEAKGKWFAPQAVTVNETIDNLLFSAEN